MKTNINQHYLPQYYLRNFAIDKSIEIYDLKLKKKYTNSISNVAYKKNFYNVDVNFFNEIIENEVFQYNDFIDKIINEYNESILASFFDSFNPTRDRIINKDESDTISIIDFHSLVDFILVQTYRNPKFSLFFKDIDDYIKSEIEVDGTKEYDKITRGIVILLLFNNLHYPKKTKFKSDVLVGFKSILEEIQLLKTLITNSYKIIYWNKTSIDFITNDCGMSFIRLEDNDIFSTIYVPINTKIAVLLVNKETSFFKNKRIKDNGAILHLEEQDKMHVETYNLAIAENANRFVFSQDGIFLNDIEKIEYKPWWNI